MVCRKAPVNANVRPHTLASPLREMMSDIASLPKWVNALISELKEAASQLTVTVIALNSMVNVDQQRASYVKLVRDFVEVRDALNRFKFFLKVDGLDDFRQKLIDGGRKLELGFDELSLTFSETRNVLFVDTETTGLGANDEPITIAAVLKSVECGTGKARREFHSYYGEREPLCAISPGAARIHGISKSQLSGKRFDGRELVALFGASDYVVAHNAEFDRRMLRVVLPDEYNWRCSIRSVNWPDDTAGRSLDALCEYFSVQRTFPHNAMSDVRALISLLSQHRNGGTTFLSDIVC